jgi:cytosine/adenosine deaminase-related metal-dependent hydrolase
MLRALLLRTLARFAGKPPTLSALWAGPLYFLPSNATILPQLTTGRPKAAGEAKMATTLIKNAKAIVTADDRDRVIYNGNLLIEDGVITYVGAVAQPAGKEIDATGCYVYPGLVNTHHHLYQTFTRNLPAVQKMELFPWLAHLYEIWRGLNDECVYHASLVGMGELLKYGCTTIMDPHYVFPKAGSGAFIDQQFRAADALGVRFTATRGSMSRGMSDGGLPPDDLVQDVETILTDSERLVKKFHDNARYSMHQVALAPCSPFSVTTELLKESAKLARQLGVRLHTHLCETKDEERFCLELHGKRPLAYMEDCGWLGGDVWYAHGIWFNDDELRRLAETKTGVAHCPVSNMKLASGVCRVPEMLELGVPLGLAVDGSASNDCSNLLAELRASYLLHRLHYSNAAPDGYELLKTATRGSAGILGRDDIGHLAEGMAADLFLLDAGPIELVGADQDPKCLPGTVGYSRPAKLVMVNGRVVAEDGKLLGINEKSVAEKAAALAHELLAKAGRSTG